MKAWLQLIIIGAGIFKDERANYFRNRSKKLLEKIQEVVDSDFYHKDMEKKGKAERKLNIEIDSLRDEYIKEGSK